MFDYKDLVKPVRMLLGDTPINANDEIFSFQRDSFKIILSEDGFATIDSIVVDNVEIPSDSYSVDENIITFDDIIPSGSSVSISYKILRYTDEIIAEHIGNTILYYIQALTNKEYGFGEGTSSESTTKMVITSNESSLFVHGTVLNIIGINLLQVSGDAIFIKDGDTTIDTKVASQAAGGSYRDVLSRFNYLFKVVRTNTFQGVVMGG